MGDGVSAGLVSACSGLGSIGAGTPRVTPQISGAVKVIGKCWTGKGVAGCADSHRIGAGGLRQVIFVRRVSDGTAGGYGVAGIGDRHRDRIIRISCGFGVCVLIGA